MDVERAFLGRVVTDGLIHQAVKARITVEFFKDPQWRRVYEFLLDHWRKYSQSADLVVVAANFPTYTWDPGHYSFNFLVDSLRDRRARTIMLDGLNQAAALVASADLADTEKMLDILRNTVMQATVETTPSMDLRHEQAGGHILDLLEERSQSSGYLRGVSTGFPGIDYVTGGYQPEQLVTLIGLPKSFKSATLLYSALHCQLRAESVLFVGFEMSNEEQLERASSLLSGVALTKILTGSLGDPELRLIRQGWARRELMPTMVFSCDIENATTVSGLQAKVMEYQPSILFVDSAYLMRSELPKIAQESAAAATDIARSLKKLAQSMSIPIVVTTQATSTRSRGGKLNADSAMYTQAWRQSSDVLLGVQRLDPDAPDDGEVAILLKVLATRSGPRADTELVWDWNRGRCLDVTQSVGSSVP